jgi:hypothetical protein
MYSSWIKEALNYIGVDSASFTGVCARARRGGLTTAIEPEVVVPEVVLSALHHGPGAR